jgi:hypothetical protein
MSDNRHINIFFLGLYDNILKTEAVCSPETLVPNYQTTRCHNLKEHLRCRKSGDNGYVFNKENLVSRKLDNAGELEKSFL